MSHSMQGLEVRLKGLGFYRYLLLRYRSLTSVVQLAFEDIVFSAGGGFLFGAVAGYSIRKLIKLAAIIVGLLVIALSYLSYKGWLDVKWISIETSAKSTLSDITDQAIHALNNTASHFQAHPAAIGSVGLPTAAAFGFIPGLFFGLRRG
jgi:uncharacterized membrane protein (Fun14 family)